MRKLLLALVIVTAGVAVADHLAWRQSQQRLSAMAESSGLSRWRPDTVVELRRRTASTRAATQLAWRLLELETDRSRLAELSAAGRRAEARRGIERLRLAEQLAGEVLPFSPASWQALTALGASRYLAAGREGRREAPAASWRQPLLAAMHLAPAYADPAILLASAELSSWSGLTAVERDAVVPVLARAFQGLRGLDLLLPTWIRLAPTYSRLLEPIPDHPAAWKRLGEEFRRIGDLDRFADAHLRWRASLPASYQERLADLRARRRGAMELTRPVLAAPHGSELAPVFAAALSLLPDETIGGRTGDQLRRWLRWALDLCLLGRCPLDGATLLSLARRAPELDPAEHALAALAAGDSEAASRLQLAAGDGDNAAWSAYWLYRAQRLASSDPEAARRALARAGADRGGETRRRLVRLRIAEAEGAVKGIAEARLALARLERADWPPDAWVRRGRDHVLEVVAAAPRDGVRLILDPNAPAAAVLELLWNGELVGAAALGPGESHHWRFPVTPGVHLAEVTNLAGRPLRPAGLSLGRVPAAG